MAVLSHSWNHKSMPASACVRRKPPRQAPEHDTGTGVGPSLISQRAAWLAHWTCDFVPVLQALTLVRGTVQHQPLPLTWTLAMTLTLAMTVALLGNATRGSCVGGTTATQHWLSQR